MSAQACGKHDTDSCSLSPDHPKLWGYYKWLEIIKTVAEKDMDDDEIVESRKFTTVKWDFQGKITVFELVTDGSTCFLDIKIWRGIYREMMDLKLWKTKVAATELSCVCFFACVVVVVAVPRVNCSSRVVFGE